jgi:hypothetical protein
MAVVSDGAGGQTETWADHLTDVPCRAWSDARRDGELDQGGKVTVVEDRRIIVGLGVDVTESDRVGEVTDRGRVILDGPMLISAIGRHTDHLDLFVAREA